MKILCSWERVLVLLDNRYLSVCFLNVWLLCSSVGTGMFSSPSRRTANNSIALRAATTTGFLHWKTKCGFFLASSCKRTKKIRCLFASLGFIRIARVHKRLRKSWNTERVGSRGPKQMLLPSEVGGVYRVAPGLARKGWVSNSIFLQQSTLIEGLD